MADESIKDNKVSLLEPKKLKLELEQCQCSFCGNIHFKKKVRP